MKKLFVSLLFAAVLCGCHSDQYYHNEAVERARKYLLENSSDLSSEQIYFVRFNAPVLLHAPVLNGGAASANRLSAEKHQICVTWMIPGKKELYMVVGVSGGRMSDWYPVRIVRKEVVKSHAVLPEAAAKCVAYAGKNLFHELSARELNQVRYAMPYLLSTGFELNFNPEGKLDEVAVAAAKKRAEVNKQYSVVWKFSGRNLVFTGVAAPGFKGWNIMMAELMDDAELARHTRMELMTPEDYCKPFPADREAASTEK